MRMGLIKPGFPDERRVALLPEHIAGFDNELTIERGFGATLGIGDKEYERAGCSLATHEEILSNYEAVFSLKTIQPPDYELLRKGQIIVGWTHPTQSGLKFMKEQGIPKELYIVDIANNAPNLYYCGRKYPIEWIPKNFNYRNALLAGYASTYHAIMEFGRIIDSSVRIAVLGEGNVSQGAFYLVSKLGADVRLFYRKTMGEFKNSVSEFDIIINGIEIDKVGEHILTLDEQTRIKRDGLVIDAAADAGGAIEGTRYTTISNPMYEANGVHYYVVNNSPAIFYRSISFEISKALSKYVFKHDIERYRRIVENHEGAIVQQFDE